MRLTSASTSLGLLALAITASAPASAQEEGWYAGGNIGATRAKIDDPRITSTLLGAGLASTITDRNRDNGYKLYGGYQFNRNFAVEGGYFDLGRFGFTANTVPAGSLNGNIRLKGLNLDGLGILPLSERFSVFGRLGVNYAQARDQFSTTGAVTMANLSPSKSQMNYKYGAGLMYAINDSLGVRLEAERYRVNDAVGNRGHIDMVSLGLVYRFGAKSPTPVPRAMAQEPVVVAAAPVPVAPPPAPPVVVAPPPVVVAALRQVSFSSDSLFDFDRSVVKPAGRQALDKFAADLRDLQYDTVKVTGHADRIGSHAYNQKLSTRRAEAVSAYLIDSGGVPASKVQAVGVDGAHPVTRPEDCKGSQATPQLIACLQPDRRVEVVVSGTR